jgi:iron-sulfur cluster assembly protein
MITLTDNAVEKLSTLITGSMKLRVLVKGTGCSGMAYHLEYNIMNTDLDDEFMVRGIPVVIDKKSQVYVEGAEIDHKTKGLNEGFEFYNPKEKARCGCGESFTV